MLSNCSSHPWGKNEIYYNSVNQQLPRLNYSVCTKTSAHYYRYITHNKI